MNIDKYTIPGWWLKNHLEKYEFVEGTKLTHPQHRSARSSNRPSPSARPPLASPACGHWPFCSAWVKVFGGFDWGKIGISLGTGDFLGFSLGLTNKIWDLNSQELKNQRCQEIWGGLFSEFGPVKWRFWI